MKRISRVFLFGALVLALLMAGCGGEEGTSTPVGTLEPGDNPTSYPPPLETETLVPPVTEATSTTTATEAATSTSAATATADTTQTPAGTAIAIDVNVIECQFCIDTRAYALLDIPETGTFEIVEPASPDPDTVCNTVDTFQNRQIVLCRAPEETSLTLNVCTDANTCSQVTVDLQTCPDTAATPQPGSATNTPTPGAGTSTVTPEASPTATADTGVPTSTPTP
jgi:hypothetical protein